MAWVIAGLQLLSLVGIAPSTMAQIVPPPSVFAAGQENRLGLTFTPDGTGAFWVEWNGTWGSRSASPRAIYTSRYRFGSWSDPVPAPFSNGYSDSDPFVSPDGRWLYFVSDRPVRETDGAGDDNIWRYELVDDNTLEHLAVNSKATEYSPVVAASGALYFASDRAGGAGQGDLYRAAPVDSGFHPPKNMGAAFNTGSGEWNLWVSAGESEVIFEASSRPTNVSIPGDLYYSWRTPAGWTAALPIESLNSHDSDLMPRLHPNAETLYYTTAPIRGHAQIIAREWKPLRAQARATYAPILIVANRSSHTVSFVDLARGEVVADVATGKGPHLLSNVSDGRVLATGYGEFPEPHAMPVTSRPPFASSPNAGFTLIDVADRTVVRHKILEGCSKPHASWLVGDRAYVTCELEGQVLVVDLGSGEEVGDIDTLQRGSHVLSFEPDSRTLAISNTESGSVTLINVDTGDTKIVSLAAGSEGSQAIDGHIWVGNAIDGSVSVVDPRTATVVQQIDSVCKFPIALSKGADGRVWVACFASSELVALAPGTFEVKQRIALDNQPLNLLAHPTRALAYVSLPRQNAIAEISLVDGSELRRIPVGIEPDGLRWATVDSS